MVVYCGVKGCNRNARVDRNHTFFRIPRTPAVCEKWLEFAGVTKDGKNLYICIDHFEEKYIWKRHPRRLLSKNSIPTIKPAGRAKANGSLMSNNGTKQSLVSVDEDMAIDEQKENENQTNEMNVPAAFDLNATHNISEEAKVFSTPQRGQPVAERRLHSDDSQESGIKITPKTLRIKTQWRTISNLRSKIYRLKHQGNQIVKQKKKLSQQKLESLVQDSAPFLSKEAQVLFETQLRLAGLNKFGKRYTDNMKDIALSILYHSPKAYRYLKKLLNLPSERTLRNYQSKFPIYPGLNQSVLNSLKYKFKHASESDKIVSLILDEINLTPEVHYDPHSDKFIGFADDGAVRDPQVAKSAVVAMLTWVTKNAKQIIGYYLLGGTGNSPKIHQLIFDSIDKVHKQGLIVKNIIFDQGPRNQGFITKVGVTINRPYFLRNGEKIYVFYDPPHLIKSIRNNLVHKILQYKDGLVDWKDICTVFNLSKSNPLNLLPKISQKHFKLSKWSKMRVSLAAQIFSESMYTAHLVYKTIFPEKFCTNSTTAQFIIDMDKLFDSLNSSLLKKNLPQKLNYAISTESEHIEFMRSLMKSLETTKFVVGPQPPCIKGLQLTISAVIQLFEDLSENYDIKHLSTRRLNQDPLEKNLFASIRQQHGCSLYPSPMHFEAGLRHILITHLTKISNLSNCEADMDHIIAKLSCIKNMQSEDATPSSSNAIICITNADLVDSAPQSEVQEFTESNAVYYICGYLCKKFLAHHNCTDCEKILIDKNNNLDAEHKLYVIMKSYADTHGLLYATENVFNTIIAWERIFKSVIQSIVHSNTITQVLSHILLQSCKKLDLCTVDSSETFLKSFLKIRCHWEARFIRRKISESSIKIDNKPALATAKMRKFVGNKV